MQFIAKRRLLKEAQNQIGMCQEDYVAMLERVTGHPTSLALNHRQIDKVLLEFKRLGYVNPRKGNQRLIKKITHLWMLLGEKGKLANPSRRGMWAFCARFLEENQNPYRACPSELSKCIEALKAWCDREGIDY